MKTINKIETCDFCGGKVMNDYRTIDFHYKRKLLIIENVPVNVCVECGEKYYNAEVWKQLEKIANSRITPKRKIVVPIKEYKVASL